MNLKIFTVMVLQTNLEHIATADELTQTISTHKNVMVCCGRMGPMCIPVYGVMEELRKEYPHIAFRDMAFDTAGCTYLIRKLPETSSFMGLAVHRLLQKW
jgi:thioredoxin 1